MARRNRSFFFNNKTGELKSDGKTLIDTTSSDNLAQVKGSSTGNPVQLLATGDDTNIDIRISPKGSGNVEVLGTLEILTGKRITDSAGTKVEFGDDIDMNSNKISELGTPTTSTDAATKGYVDTYYLPLTGGTISSNLTISGDLTVSGTTTTVNSETISLADNILELNSNASGAPTENAGITVNRGSSADVTLRWNETSDVWEMTTDGSTYQTIGSLASSDTDDLSEGSTNLYYTDARVRSAISVTDAGGDGSLTYNSTTGVITYTGPNALALAGGTMSGAIAMGTNKITGMGDPTAAQDAATKAYVDSQVSSVPTGDITAVNITAGTGLSGTVTTASGDHTQTLSIDSTVATLTDTQTLTNKTLTSPIISSISNTGTLTLPTSTGTVALTSDITLSTLSVTSTAAELNILDGITATTAELNILDGVTSTAVELNIIDGDTAATSTTLADADRVVVNDAGTMKQVALTDFETYFETALDTLSNVTSVGTLNGITIASTQTIDMGANRVTNVADPVGNQDAATKAYVDANAGSGGGTSGFTASTFTSAPGADGDYDLSYNNAQTVQETPFEAGGSDAFGVSLGEVFDQMEPTGSLSEVDLGAFT